MSDPVPRILCFLSLTFRNNSIRWLSSWGLNLELNSWLPVWLLSHSLFAKIVVSLQDTKFRPFWNFMGTQRDVNEEDSTPKPIFVGEGNLLTKSSFFTQNRRAHFIPLWTPKIKYSFSLGVLRLVEKGTDQGWFLGSCIPLMLQKECTSHENGWVYILFLAICCNSVCVSIENIHIGRWVTRLCLQDHQKKYLYWSRDHCWAGSGSYLWCFNSQM